MASFDQPYSQKVMEHLRHPKNMGEMKNPDGMATVGNPTCGDIMRLFLRIEKKKGQKYVKDAKFQTLGCGAAIATSSMVTTMIKGKSLKEAEKITQKTLDDALGGLPSSKTHCALLAADALKKAILDSLKKD